MNIDWFPEELHPAAMRLARADELAYQLAEVCLSWSCGDDYRGAVQFVEYERTKGVRDLEVESIRPVPPIAGMLFSEAINHLRAAIDNVVFYLVTKDREEPLTVKQERIIGMPIYDDQAKFNTRIRSLVKAGLVEFGGEEVLGKRIELLQPFNDSAEITVTSGFLAFLMGRPDRQGYPPLLLLQAYSNEDKHRSVRVASIGALTQRDDDPLPSGRWIEPIHPGMVLAKTEVGKPSGVSVSPALGVLRPNDGTWVAMGAELDGIARHVSDVVFPMLVCGMVIPDGLPTTVEMGDNGKDYEQRITEAGAVRAHTRFRSVANEALWKVMQRPVSHPRVVPHEEVNPGPSGDSKGAAPN